MTPEMTHRALRDIESAIEVAESRDIMDTGAARAALYYLRSKVDRLEGEIERYREEPDAKMLCKIHGKIPADPNGFIVTYEQLDAALEAYRSAVK